MQALACFICYAKSLRALETVAISAWLKVMKSFLPSHSVLVSDIRDNLVQALACFICYAKSLRALETVAISAWLKVMKSFLPSHSVLVSDIRDNLVQALACFICYAKSLRALETAPISARLKVVKALLSPYENRSWAQTNWILVRIWKVLKRNGDEYKHGLMYLKPIHSTLSISSPGVQSTPDSQ